MSAAIEARNTEATVYVGNLDEKVHDDLLYELMLQIGPVVSVHIPKDKINSKHAGYGFVEFRSDTDAEYAIKVMNMVKLYGKPIKVNKTSTEKKIIDIGANIFIGNLESYVDEKMLYDTFSAFGGITETKIVRDLTSGESKGFGFVSFDSFQSADLAIECMNGQFLYDRTITAQYAFIKDSRSERHGSQVERMMAAAQVPQKFTPHTFFSSGVDDSNIGMMNQQPPPPPPQLQMAYHDPMMGNNMHNMNPYYYGVNQMMHFPQHTMPNPHMALPLPHMLMPPPPPPMMPAMISMPPHMPPPPPPM